MKALVKIRESLARRKLLKVFKREISRHNYPRLGHILAVVELVVYRNRNMMDLSFLDDPFCDQKFQELFLAELKNCGFPMTLPVGGFFFNTDPDFLAKQYPNTDFAEICFAWWESVVAAMDKWGVPFDSSTAETVIDFLVENYDGEGPSPAVDVLNLLAEECP